MKKEYDWRTGRSCVYKLQYHLVFVTKYRKGVFRQEQLQRLEEVFAETCEQMEGELLEFSGGKRTRTFVGESATEKSGVECGGETEGKIVVCVTQRIWGRIEGEVVGKTLVESELLCGIVWRSSPGGDQKIH